MKNLNKLKSVRNSDTAIFLGCGPSIKDLNEDLINKINKLDVWSSNNFLLNEDITADFHHIEIIQDRNGKLFDTLREIRKDSYGDIIWLMDNKVEEYVKSHLHSNWKNKIYSYNKLFRNSDDGFYKPTNDNDCQLSCSTPEIHANLTVILDLMCKVGYKKIFFLGVDLYSSSYFWTDDKRYDKYNIPDAMRVEGRFKNPNKSKNNPHETHKTAKFVKEFGEHNNIDFINLSKNSLLKDFITTIDYDKFLEEEI